MQQKCISNCIFIGIPQNLIMKLKTKKKKRKKIQMLAYLKIKQPL